MKNKKQQIFGNWFLRVFASFKTTKPFVMYQSFVNYLLLWICNRKQLRTSCLSTERMSPHCSVYCVTVHNTLKLMLMCCARAHSRAIIQTNLIDINLNWSIIIWNLNQMHSMALVNANSNSIAYLMRWFITFTHS